VPKDPNSDVDRAMATFTATPMPYHSFANTPAAPVGLDQAALPSGDFPLLVAALPEVTEFPMPHSADRTIGREHPGNRPAATPMQTETKGPAAHQPAMAPASFKVQTFAAIPTPEQAGLATRPTVPLAVNTRFPQSMAPVVPKQHAVAPLLADTHTQRTPMSAVFRTLLAVGSSHEKRTELPSGLQNLFNLL